MSNVIKMSDLPRRADRKNNRSTTRSVVTGRMPEAIKMHSEGVKSNELVPLHKAINANAWQGQTVYIVGGGPSLKDFDWKWLRGKIVIAVNQYPLLRVPNPAMLVAMDKRSYAWTVNGELGPELQKAYNEYPGYKVYLSSAKIDKVSGHYSVNNLGAGAFSRNIADGVGNGNNSGYVALNIAFALGASKIYLLGFDMQGATNHTQEWWHKGYKSVQPADVYTKFIHYIKDALPIITGSGVDLINVNYNGKLSPIPEIGFDDLYDAERCDDLPTVISFYTPEYSRLVPEFKRNALLQGLNIDVQQRESLGSWVKNAAQKPDFILEKMKEYKSPVMWIDIDGTVNRRFNDLSNFDGKSVGVHYRVNSSNSSRELLSGSIVVGYSANTKSLIRRWGDICRNDDNVWDQIALKTAIDNTGPGKTEKVNIIELSAQYCKIFDLMAAVKDPFITHYQASRQLKRVVNDRAGLSLPKATLFIGNQYGIQYKLSDMGIDPVCKNYPETVELAPVSPNPIVWSGIPKALYDKLDNPLFMEGAPFTPDRYWIDSKGYHSDSLFTTSKAWNGDVKSVELIDDSYNPDGFVLVCMQSPKYITTAEYCAFSDTTRAIMDACRRHLKGIEVRFRPHPLWVAECVEELLAAGDSWDVDNFRLDLGGDFTEALKGCRGVICINSSVHAKALYRMLPVATFGKGLFTGAGVTIDCSRVASRVRKLKGPREIAEDTVGSYIGALMQWEVKRDFSDLPLHPAFREWYSRVTGKDNVQETGKVQHLCTCWPVGASDEVEQLAIEFASPKRLCQVVSPTGPPVSIMMPCYNASGYIDKAIESVVNQSYKDWELNIVNDASTDNSIDVAAKWAGRDSRVRILHHDSNMWEAAARNTALRYSNGAIVARLDADDFWAPNFLDKTVSYLIKNPNIDCVSTGMMWGPVDNMVRYNADHGMIPDGYMAGKQGCNPVNGSIVAWKLIYDVTGGFNESLRLGCDGDWDIKACLAGARWGFIPEPLYYYNRHDKQSVHGVSAEVTRNNLQRIADAKSEWGAAPHRYCDLFVTSRCNKHCSKCSQMPFMEYLGDYTMRIQEVETFIQDTMYNNIHYEMLSITGGEPFMNPELPEIIAMLRKYNIANKIRLFTNGVIASNGVMDSVDSILCTLRDFNADAASRIKMRYGDKATVQTSTFKQLPARAISGAVPAKCNCLGRLYAKNFMYICPNAGAHLTRGIANNVIAKCSIKGDWYRAFMNTNRDAQTICSYCLGNRRVWSKVDNEGVEVE